MEFLREVENYQNQAPLSLTSRQSQTSFFPDISIILQTDFHCLDMHVAKCDHLTVS